MQEPESGRIPKQPEVSGTIFVCCGLPMNYQEVFGIRIWHCSYRGYHTVFFENLYTGKIIADSDLEVKEQNKPE